MSTPGTPGGAPAKLSEQQLAALHRVLQSVITYTNRNHRCIAQRFYSLPPREEYGDVRSVIKHPRSLASVQHVLTTGRYATPRQVYEDLKLVFLQGQEFYKRSSEMYRDSDKMNQTLDDVWTGEVFLPTLADMGVRSTRGEEEQFDEAGNKRRLDRLTPLEIEYSKSFGAATHALHAEFFRAVTKGTAEDAVDIDEGPTRAGSEIVSRAPTPMRSPSPPPIEEFNYPPPHMTFWPEDDLASLRAPAQVASQGDHKRAFSLDAREPPVASTSRLQPASPSSAWMKDAINVVSVLGGRRNVLSDGQDQYEVFHQIVTKLKTAEDPE
jgi:hypothetical protein